METQHTEVFRHNKLKKFLNKKGIKNQIYSKDPDNKYYMLNYTEFIPDLINCIKISK